MLKLLLAACRMGWGSSTGSNQADRGCIYVSIYIAYMLTYFIYMHCFVCIVHTYIVLCMYSFIRTVRTAQGRPGKALRLALVLQMALWSSMFVLSTLLINAPLIPWLARVTGLLTVSPVKRSIREKAKRALIRSVCAVLCVCRQGGEGELHPWGAGKACIGSY